MNNTKGRGELYPWQVAVWQQLMVAKQKQRLPHALLLVGTSGLGKERFASALAHAMLCSRTDAEGYPCGECHACHLVEAQSHPDCLIVAAEQSGQAIKVDQIREVVHFINETAQQGGFRVVIIQHAHNMNHNAANSLLKTLEEPTPNTLFILLSAHGQRLPATIRSRCQIFTLRAPERALALSWLRTQSPDFDAMSDELLHVVLNLAQGAPLRAQAIVADDTLAYRQQFYQGLLNLSQGQASPLQLAAQWYERDFQLLFNFLFYWLQDILKLQVTAGAATLINLDHRDALSQLALGIAKERVLAYLTHVQMIYAKITSSLNLNRQLMLEELLVQWTLIKR